MYHIYIYKYVHVYIIYRMSSTFKNHQNIMLFWQTLRVNHEISDHQDVQLHSLRYCTFCLTAVRITRYSKAVEKSVCRAKSSTLSKQTRAPFVRGTTFSFWSFLGLFLVSNLVICRSLRCRHLLPALTHRVARSRSLHNRFSQVVGMEALMKHPPFRVSLDSCRKRSWIYVDLDQVCMVVLGL